MPLTISDYAIGRTTRRGEAVPHEVIPTVTAVETGELGAFLGSRNRAEIQEHLRSLRAQGILICRGDRLQAKVRTAGGQRRAYVFKGSPEEVPRLGPELAPRRARVIQV